jgi:selenocysteine-specific elongation factor
VAPSAGRWLLPATWDAARDAIEREVRVFADRHPARFGVMKGDLKSGLKGTLDAALFDVAFEGLARDAVVVQRGERVRAADSPWEPPADVVAALERLESRLEAAGFQAPENAAWQKELGASATEVAALGFFQGRLVRVSQDYTYTARQMDLLRAKLAAHFEKAPTLNVSDFKSIAGVSRKWAVPLLEHCDRSGWTVRVGDERRRGRG